MSNLPQGSEYRKDAPWNQEDDIKEVEVYVTITYSKKVKVLVNKDYNKEDLDEATMNQTWLPVELLEFLKSVENTKRHLNKKTFEDELKWNIEEFKVEEI